MGILENRVNLREEVVDEQRILSPFSVDGDQLEGLGGDGLVTEVRLVCRLDLPADSQRSLRALTARDLGKAFLSLSFVLHLVNIYTERPGLARQTKAVHNSGRLLSISFHPD